MSTWKSELSVLGRCAPCTSILSKGSSHVSDSWRHERQTCRHQTQRSRWRQKLRARGWGKPVQRIGDVMLSHARNAESFGDGISWGRTSDSFNFTTSCIFNQWQLAVSHTPAQQAHRQGGGGKGQLVWTGTTASCPVKMAKFSTDSCN